MNVFNFLKQLRDKQRLFYDNNPRAFWLHSSLTLVLSGFTFVKTVRSMKEELDWMFGRFIFP